MASSSGYDAVVVGAGPNGLAAGVTIAAAGHSVLVVERSATVGGGARTAELTLPGFNHDVCAAVHPLGVASPFFRHLPLQAHGLEWLEPRIPMAHPLDGGDAAVLHHSVLETAAGFGPAGDGRAYRRAVERLVRNWDRVLPSILAPIARPPAHPLAMARFGVTAVRSARSVAGRFEGGRARALVASLAAHSILPLHHPLTASVALVFAGAAHTGGWPVARGGSQAIVDALASHLRSLGGEIETGRLVERIADLPPARAVLLDVTPRQFVAMAGDQLPPRGRRRMDRFRYGPGVFKVDYALDGPVPWEAEACRHAGTVHAGGTFEEVAASEVAAAEGRIPERPLVLIAQPSVIDPSRAPAGKHTLWAYCHAPHGSAVDFSAAIENQIERFAPGFRDLILAKATMSAVEFEAYNPNYVGGDIAGGSQTGLQMVFRPGVSLSPYRTPLPNVYLCSASTPPGGGVHGMCGHNAAADALRHSLS
jgi:phytoene dehydrogenase-like protein